MPVSGCPCELATVPPTDAAIAVTDIPATNANAIKTEQSFFIAFSSLA
jgi:hypothetical protein